ncbi:MAG: aldo/keto reductase [Candidatus Thorarchaeota archaeon]
MVKPEGEVKDTMKRVLGKTKVSAMGMGCWAIGGPFLHSNGRVLAYGKVDDKESIKAVRKGIELGVTLFDTSNVYGCGRSERVLGEALKGYREEVQIATKFASVFDKNSGNPDIPCRISGNDITSDGIMEACYASLERLQTDYIDLYQLHDGDMEPKEVPRVVSVLDELVDEGKIRSYGWSTDDPERAALFAEQDNCSAVQFRHNIFNHNYVMIDTVIERHGVTGLIKGPLGYGFLTGKYTENSTVPKDHMWHDANFREERMKKQLKLLDDLKRILTSDGRTLAQAALGWIWAEHKRLIPIPGFKNISQVTENASALELGPLNQKIVDEVNQRVSEFKES